jgi:2-polyprenyl-3-methyl-5-hydroxy-6-metoxy-1,4-benzoquinol methylase
VGTGYSERTKNVSRYFKKEFKKLQDQTRTTKFYRPQLISNYIYKGPSWNGTLRIKLRLEKNYEPLAKMIPAKASILDLGCGYGFLAYMLSFLSEDRIITGVDYDEDKIHTANNCYAKSERINFICADITSFPLRSYDVILLN